MAIDPRKIRRRRRDERKEGSADEKASGKGEEEKDGVEVGEVESGGWTVEWCPFQRNKESRKADGADGDLKKSAE